LSPFRWRRLGSFSPDSFKKKITPVKGADEEMIGFKEYLKKITVPRRQPL
jgi:hypothetical protein